MTMMLMPQNGTGALEYSLKFSILCSSATLRQYSHSLPVNVCVYLSVPENLMQICKREKKDTLLQIPAAVIALWEISVHVGLLQMGRTGRVTQHFSGPPPLYQLPSLSPSVNNPWLGERAKARARQSLVCALM